MRAAIKSMQISIILEKWPVYGVCHIGVQNNQKQPKQGRDLAKQELGRKTERSGTAAHTW